MRVDIVNYYPLDFGMSLQQMKEHCPTTYKGLNIGKWSAIKLLRQIAIKLQQQLSFASRPFQEWLNTL